MLFFEKDKVSPDYNKISAGSKSVNQTCSQNSVLLSSFLLLLIPAAFTACTSNYILIVLFRVGFELMRKFGRTRLHDLQCENWRFW